MRIYLAARYSRREELCRYREQLRSMGHVVTSRWLDGSHQISNTGEPIGDNGEALVESGDCERSAQMRQELVAEDFKDVLTCELLIAFTEQPRAKASRGGRHVELGMALGMMKRVWIVGPRENIFCWLEDVRLFDCWDDLASRIHNYPTATR